MGLITTGLTAKHINPKHLEIYATETMTGKQIQERLIQTNGFFLPRRAIAPYISGSVVAEKEFDYVDVTDKTGENIICFKSKDHDSVGRIRYQYAENSISKQIINAWFVRGGSMSYFEPATIAKIKGGNLLQEVSNNDFIKRYYAVTKRAFNEVEPEQLAMLGLGIDEIEKLQRDHGSETRLNNHVMFFAATLRAKMAGRRPAPSLIGFRSLRSYTGHPEFQLLAYHPEWPNGAKSLLVADEVSLSMQQLLFLRSLSF